MRCYCCDADEDNVNQVKDVYLCKTCRAAIRSARQDIYWSQREENPLAQFTTRQEALTWRGTGPRKNPKPTLKEPDFDLYKRGDSDE